jgi:hypothetical protein
VAHFFATADDLLPIFSAVERRRQLSYTLTGHVTEPNCISHDHGIDLPTLYEPIAFEASVNCPSYLITEAQTSITLRELPLRNGRRQWAIDQILNPDSTVLCHGGIYQGSLLLHGRIATVSKSPVAQSLQRAFDSQLRKHFVRIKAFYVGPNAEKLLDSGFRLTGAAQSPSEYDLSRQSSHSAA